MKYAPIQVRRFAESLNANAQIRNLPVDLLEKDIQPARSRDLVDLYKLAFGKGLKKAASPAIVRSKLASALKIKAYRKEYTRTTQNLQKHIEQLVAESASDPVFMEKPNFDELNQFAQELTEYLGKEIIPKT